MRDNVIGMVSVKSLWANLSLAGRVELRALVTPPIYAPTTMPASKLIEERGCAERVSVATGNMFDGLPAGCDVHLFSNVLHDWGVVEVKKLLAVSHAALPAGGLLIIHDAFINADKTRPLHVAEYSCLLMHSTQGKCYSTGEYAELLDEAGFVPGAYQDTAVARGFMTAIRR